MLVDLLIGVSGRGKGHNRVDEVVGLQTAFDQQGQRLRADAGEIPTRLRQRLAASAAGDNLNAIAVPLAGQAQALLPVVIRGRDQGAGVAGGAHGVFKRAVGTARFKGDVRADFVGVLLDLQASVHGHRVQRQVGVVAQSRSAPPLDGIDDRHPTRTAQTRGLRDHQPDSTESKDGDAVAQAHRAIAHRADGKVGRVPIHDGLRRNSVWGLLHARRRYSVRFADGQMREDPVAFPQRGDLSTHFDDRAQAHVAEVSREASAYRFAAAVQAQFAVPAVGCVGCVGAEAAQFGAVLDRTEEALNADFVRG